MNEEIARIAGSRRTREEIAGRRSGLVAGRFRQSPAVIAIVSVEVIRRRSAVMQQTPLPTALSAAMISPFQYFWAGCDPACSPSFPCQLCLDFFKRQEEKEFMKTYLYLSPYKSVRSRLTHLMGSDIARINDRSYMSELENRLCQWHREDINRRLEERAAEERLRILQLGLPTAKEQYSSSSPWTSRSRDLDSLYHLGDKLLYPKVEFEREAKPEEPMRLKILENAIFEHILSEEEEEDEEVFDQYAL
ncbi:unnamed protein product [Darwinula stevensoni]|uniref:Uncharacterized protein n=1 Tax=Darwinula stevensoni TaxID=69355 RepID=A0A7R9A172_9CRUS|nr:unnamed protein product [Darwinula stevensoni]CAG0886029.1 unnamed protein product [Darwinula stevensoni]